MSSGSRVRRGRKLRYAAPHLLAWRPLQRSTRLAIGAALLATASYLLFLSRPDVRGPTWLWALMLVAEGLIAFHAVGTWWTILAHDDRPEKADVTVWRHRLRAGKPAPTIDVLITACGEPEDLVITTVRAAREMRLPHTTYVLDDGRSDALAALCEQEGVAYLRRDGRAHAKAGNVNAGLARTSAEFVVILDADHVPEEDFLLQVLPHFVERDVAFVQSPQSYVNPVNLVASGAAEAQRIFYELVCPGKNHFNAAFCVGTNVMFRRAALEEIGGLWTDSNSEDLWTSLELHRRGWRSVYVPQVVARGLAPEDVGSYFKQQLRWATGGFEVLFRGRLLRRGGLTLDQRLQYCFVGTHFMLSLAMMIFMLLPATYLLFGLSPIRAGGWDWAAHYLPVLGLTLLVTWLQSGGFKLAAIVTSLGAGPVHVRALWSVVTRRRATWTVTNRASRSTASLWAVMPLVLLLVLNLTGIAVGVVVMADPAPTWLSIGWASLHVLVLGRMIGEAVLEGSGTRVRRSSRHSRRTASVVPFGPLSSVIDVRLTDVAPARQAGS
jgi:cellulose synthase (UDP-forming)